MSSAAPTQLELAILKTVIYFDLFSYPLSIFEIWRWLWDESGAELSSVTLGEVQHVLGTSDWLGSRIDEVEGLYVLKGKTDHIAIRQRRYVIAERKYTKAIRIARLISCLPHVRAISVCNNLAFSNARDESDIDLFIVTAPGRTWTARFWTAGLLKLFGLRPSAKRSRDMFCVSFFLSADALSIESVALEGGDPYLAHWVAQLIPLYDPEGMQTRFATANTWIHRSLPHARATSTSPRRRITGMRVIQHVIEVIASCVPERVYRSMQARILPPALRTEVNRDRKHVVMTDSMIKLYTTDRRAGYRTQFFEHIRTYAQ